MIGALVSCTVRVAKHCDVLPATSVAVMVMRFTPTCAVDPTAGDCETDALVQLSLVITFEVKSGTIPCPEIPVPIVRFAAQATMSGGVVSPAKEQRLNERALLRFVAPGAPGSRYQPCMQIC